MHSRNADALSRCVEIMSELPIIIKIHGPINAERNPIWLHYDGVVFLVCPNDRHRLQTVRLSWRGWEDVWRIGQVIVPRKKKQFGKINQAERRHTNINHNKFYKPIIEKQSLVSHDRQFFFKDRSETFWTQLKKIALDASGDIEFNQHEWFSPRFHFDVAVKFGVMLNPIRWRL